MSVNFFLDQAAVTIMQRMSDMLSRWLEGATRQSRQEAEGTTAGQARAATSEPDNVVSSQQSSTQSAASSSASVRDDGEQPSTSRESDYSRNQSGKSNRAKKMKSSSSDESMAGRALSGTLVGPSGAGARAMVCRLAKQLTFDVGGPSTRELHCGGNTNAKDEDSRNEAVGIDSSKGDGEDLQKFEVQHDVAVTDGVAVSNDNVTSLNDTDNQGVSLVSDTDNHATDMRTDQQMEDVSHETKVGDVTSNELTANSDVSDQDLRAHESSVVHGDTTVDGANSESECSANDVRQFVNSELSTEKSAMMAGNSAEDVKTARDADGHPGVKSFINTMVELKDSATVNRSRCGSSQTEKHVPHEPSSVSSIKRKTKQSTPDSHPMIGVNRGTIRFALANEHPRTQSDTPGVADRTIPAVYSVQSRGGIANHQLMPTEQPSDLLDDPMSIVCPDLDMSTNSVSSGSDMSTCSGEDYEALKEKTLSAETCSIPDRPHNPIPTSSTDLEKSRCHFKAAVNYVERSGDGMTRDSTDSAPVQESEEGSSIQFTDDSMKISISEVTDESNRGATSGESWSVGPRASAHTSSAVGMYCLF